MNVKTSAKAPGIHWLLILVIVLLGLSDLVGRVSAMFAIRNGVEVLTKPTTSLAYNMVTYSGFLLIVMQRVLCAWWVFKQQWSNLRERTTWAVVAFVFTFAGVLLCILYQLNIKTNSRYFGREMTGGRDE
jgi:hypothetical protein